MFSRLYNYYVITRESLFYVPALICGLYALICFGIFYVDLNYSDYYKDIPLIFNGEIRDAQAVIQVLLSAMITLSVLVVSITMVVLNLSASQLGPRLIRIFMSDRQTKIYFGLFFGSITACYVMLGLLQEAGSWNLPRLTVSFVYLCCFANLFILLSYVHHVARLSVADVIITKVYAELMASINRLNKQTGDTKAKIKGWPEDFTAKSQSVIGNKNGYIQTIDYESLRNLAQEEGLKIQILLMAGDYAIQGAQIANAYPKTKVTPEVQQHILGALVFGDTRTSAQDIEYSVRHLVEIGLRALSPGINDNYTAITVLNKLSSALSLLFEKSMATRLYANDKGETLVKGKNSREKDVIFEAFSRIRKAGENKPDILSHLIDIIVALKVIAGTAEVRSALDRQLVFINDHIKAHFEDTEEGKMLAKAHKQATK